MRKNEYKVDWDKVLRTLLNIAVYVVFLIAPLCAGLWSIISKLWGAKKAVKVGFAALQIKDPVVEVIDVHHKTGEFRAVRESGEVIHDAAPAEPADEAAYAQELKKYVEYTNLNQVFYERPLKDYCKLVIYRDGTYAKLRFVGNPLDERPDRA